MKVELEITPRGILSGIKKGAGSVLKSSGQLMKDAVHQSPASIAGKAVAGGKKVLDVTGSAMIGVGNVLHKDDKSDS